MKLFFGSQIFLRIAAVGLLLAAILVMVKIDQVAQVFGLTFEAKYQHSPAFEFFVVAESITIVLTGLSLVVVLFIGGKGSNPANYHYLFLLDLFMSYLGLTAFTAAVSIAYVGKYGYDRVGWAAICDQFEIFCHKVQNSLICSFLAFLALLILTITSASKSRQINS